MAASFDVLASVSLVIRTADLVNRSQEILFDFKTTWKVFIYLKQIQST